MNTEQQERKAQNDLLAGNIKQLEQTLNQFDRTLGKLRRDLQYHPWVGAVGSGNQFPHRVQTTRCFLDTVHNPDANNVVNCVIQDGSTMMQVRFQIPPAGWLTNLAISFNQDLRVISCDGTLVLAGRIRW